MSSGYFQNKEEFVLKMGSHLTWKELEDIEKDTLLKEEQILRDRRVDFGILPTYYTSIKNLFGYVLYKLEEVVESINVFKEVLEKDSDNLNAISNLVKIYTELGMSTSAKNYSKQLDELIEQRETLMIARALCDRAHAIRHFQQDCREFTYMPYLCQAVEIGAKIKTPERGEWLFDYGLALFRKDFQLLLARASSEEKEPNFMKAIHSFYDVILMKGASIVYKALSWVFMGILLRHDDTRLLQQCFPMHPEIHDLTSIDCIERGLALSPENEIVTRRVASEFSRVGRHIEAKELFHISLSKEKSWFAYRHQGLMYLRMYEATREEELLYNAETSFKEAIKLKDVHADHSDLGYVYFLRGQLQEALNRFRRAKNNRHNDNFDTTETHRRWAECLTAFGEHESATQHLQLADDIRNHLKNMIENIEKRGLKHGTNCHGDECQRYHSEYCRDDRKGFINIISALDMPYKTRFLIDQDNTKRPFRYDFFLSFCHIDHKWAIAFLKKLENDLNLIGCLRQRDYQLGVSIMDNIVNAITDSLKTIIIMSPNSLEDPLCNYEIQQALLENRTRECIIPLMLRPCETPRTLRAFCGIKCESGQICEHDWIRLANLKN